MTDDVGSLPYLACCEERQLVTEIWMGTAQAYVDDVGEAVTLIDMQGDDAKRSAKRKRALPIAPCESSGQPEMLADDKRVNAESIRRAASHRIGLSDTGPSTKEAEESLVEASRAASPMQPVSAPWVPIFKTIMDFTASIFQNATGVHPSAKKLDLRAKASEIDGFKQALRIAMKELATLFCHAKFFALDSYSKDGVAVGYVLKYASYNAIIAAVALVRYSRIVVPSRVLNDTTSSCFRPPSARTLRVCCYGGGPGTDWLALRYLAKYLGTSLEARVFDLPLWEQFWKADERRASPRLASVEENVRFFGMDILSDEAQSDPFGSTRCPEVTGWSPDVVTFFYTANEMAEQQDRFIHFVKAVVAGCEPETSFVFLDRTRDRSLSLLQVLSSRVSGLETIVLSQRFEITLPLHVVNKIADYAAKFGVKPRLNGKAGLTILRKTAPSVK
ncbi:hypothetical protein DIPPA_56989 [Diplonema papillatum]|nr:hypothetical protein DIPPA_56989 [Diplonema papillatum]